MTRRLPPWFWALCALVAMGIATACVDSSFARPLNLVNILKNNSAAGIVATGEGGNTPVGEFRLVERIEHPVWETGGRKIPYDGTGENGNILGTHYLKLDVPGYGIHGTWDESTLGRQSSAGCIRMRNADVADLYVLLPRQTPVVIEP